MELVLGLMVVVGALAAAADRLGILCPILLVLCGLGLALVPGLPRVEPSPEIVFLPFLPPILFAAVCETSWRDVPRDAADALRERYAHRLEQEPDSLDPADRDRDHAHAHRRMRQEVLGAEQMRGGGPARFWPDRRRGDAPG